MNDINRGEIIGKLVISLGYDSIQVKKLMKYLRDKDYISINQLEEIFLPGRANLALDLLISLGVLRKLTNSFQQGFIIWKKNIDELEKDLFLIINAHNTTVKVEQTENQNLVDIAWTLPKELKSPSDIPEHSLAGLIKHTITLADHQLIFVSPFLELDGFKLLADPIKAASNRAVQIIIVSHDLDILDSPNHEVLKFLKKVVGSLQSFTSKVSEGDKEYSLLHAKVVIADDKYAVVSSANITKYGLGSHLEIGLGFSGDAVRKLKTLISNIIESNLVREVF
jgi:phosphatidylserine/phosphatidylglycerophosphate/cardiolipin synthase-like enzyme